MGHRRAEADRGTKANALSAAGAAFAVFAIALILGGVSGSPQAKEWDGTGGPNAERPRLVVDATYYPFSAMGRVQIAGRSFCGAALIGPKTIITAGHCLWNRRRGAWWDAKDVHFVAGYQRSSFLAHGRGVRYVTPLTAENKAPDQDSIINDWALVELDREIGKQVGWLGLSSESPETIAAHQGTGAEAPSPLFLAAYRSDRAHAMSLQSHCRITRIRAHSRLIFTDCQVVPGSSGSPVVTFQDGQFKVVGVISARVPLRDRPAQTLMVTTWALRQPNGPAVEQVASFVEQWDTPFVRDDTLKRGIETLIKALSDGEPPQLEGGDVVVLDALLRDGPQHDKIALPPLQLPELQRCRDDCADSGAD